MRVLVIDTALGACAVGVFDDGVEVAMRSEAMTRGHQERLGGMAQAVLRAAGPPEAIDRIGVTVGPGSFTGLRVGLAFAEGLGLALDLPVIGLGTLAGLAASVDAKGLVAALIDARREQIYGQMFRDGVALKEPQALSPDAALALIQDAHRGDEPVVLVGSGATLIADSVPGADVRPLAAPDLKALAMLTQAAPDDATAAPLYLRAPDAKPPRDRTVGPPA